MSELFRFDRLIDAVGPTIILDEFDKIICFLYSDSCELLFVNVSVNVEMLLDMIMRDPRKLRNAKLRYMSEGISELIINVMDMNKHVFEVTCTYEYYGNPIQKILAYKKSYFNISKGGADQTDNSSLPDAERQQAIHDKYLTDRYILLQKIPKDMRKKVLKTGDFQKYLLEVTSPAYDIKRQTELLTGVRSNLKDVKYRFDDLSMVFKKAALQTMLDFLEDHLRATLVFEDKTAMEFTFLYCVMSKQKCKRMVAFLPSDSQSLLMKVMYAIDRNNHYKLHIVEGKMNKSTKRRDVTITKLPRFESKNNKINNKSAPEAIEVPKAINIQRDRSISKEGRGKSSGRQLSAGRQSAPCADRPRKDPMNPRTMKLLEDMATPLKSDKAMKMMKSMGWDGGALGARGEGITEPIIPALGIVSLISMWGEREIMLIPSKGKIFQPGGCHAWGTPVQGAGLGHTEPTKPPKPAGPMVPVSPVVPMGPVVSMGPVIPVGRSVPMGPVVPMGQVVPRSPVVPVGPVVPKAPVVPMGPVNPKAPVGPVIPKAPVVPVVVRNKQQLCTSFLQDVLEFVQSESSEKVILFAKALPKKRIQFMSCLVSKVNEKDTRYCGAILGGLEYIIREMTHTPTMRLEMCVTEDLKHIRLIKSSTCPTPQLESKATLDAQKMFSKYPEFEFTIRVILTNVLEFVKSNCLETSRILPRNLTQQQVTAVKDAITCLNSGADNGIVNLNRDICEQIKNLTDGATLVLNFEDMFYTMKKLKYINKFTNSSLSSAKEGNTDSGNIPKQNSVDNASPDHLSSDDDRSGQNDDDKKCANEEECSKTDDSEQSTIESENSNNNENDLKTNNICEIPQSNSVDFKTIHLAPKDYPKETIKRAKIKEFQISISDTIDKGKELPLLNCHGVKNGALVYGCHDNKSFEFLKQIVDNFNDLTLVDHNFEEANDNFTIAIKVNSFDENIDNLFIRLKQYNERLLTKEWKVLKKVVLSDFIVITAEIDRSSYDYICEQRFSLYAGIDKVQCSLVWD